jgi:hypothetical protein
LEGTRARFLIATHFGLREARHEGYVGSVGKGEIPLYGMDHGVAALARASDLDWDALRAAHPGEPIEVPDPRSLRKMQSPVGELFRGYLMYGYKQQPRSRGGSKAPTNVRNKKARKAARQGRKKGRKKR